MSKTERRPWGGTFSRTIRAPRWRLASTLAEVAPRRGEPTWAGGMSNPLHGLHLRLLWSPLCPDKWMGAFDCVPAGGTDLGKRASFDREGKASRGWYVGAGVAGARNHPARRAIFLRGVHLVVARCGVTARLQRGWGAGEAIEAAVMGGPPPRIARRRLRY